nr:hypothetical protein [Chitinophaga sp. HK235]
MLVPGWRPSILSAKIAVQQEITTANHQKIYRQGHQTQGPPKKAPEIDEPYSIRFTRFEYECSCLPYLPCCGRRTRSMPIRNCFLLTSMDIENRIKITRTLIIFFFNKLNNGANCPLATFYKCQPTYETPYSTE